MIVNFSLVNELFRAYHIQRWNDRIRPMDLIEMDKHAHKMIIAYTIAKYEEDKGNSIDWQTLIKDGIYELIRRIVISDIKSPIYAEIKKNKTVFEELNKYVYRQVEPKIENVIIKNELQDFLFNDTEKNDLTKRVLDAAHIFSSFWEFQIIKQANPFSYQNIRIETELLNKINQYADLEGIQKLIHKHTISNFIDLCGQLRFQMRWAQVPRVPKTSVLGHILLVGIISYFFTRENEACDKRLYNAFFGGLFHDLPEAVTRDIISPVKRSSEEFDSLIKNLEQQLAEKEIFPLIDHNWLNEIKYFSIDEFDNKVEVEGKIINKDISIELLNTKYNQNSFNPYDGEIIRAADHLTAFLEAWNSCSAGIKTEELSQAAQNIKDMYKNKSLGNVAIKNLYSNFKSSW
ncbi:MAG TPA: HD domain-containing protein [Candidatus Kapabacteria bacterium]|nr:HD domain-containing protein [Candidatus Kapabacteria bacterium]